MQRPHDYSRRVAQMQRQLLRTTIALSLLLLLCALAAASITVGISSPLPMLDTAANDAVQLYHMANRVHDNKTRAIELYQEAIKRYPLAQAYNNLGLLLSETQCLGPSCSDRDAALAIFAQGARVALDANETATLAAIESNIGYTIRDVDKKSIALCLQAIEHFDRALAANPNHVSALFNKASALYEMHEFAAAEQLNRRVLELEPDHVGANTDISAILFFTQRDYKQAIQHQDAIIASARSTVIKRAAFINKATMLRGSAQFARAFETATLALTLFPDDSRVLAELVIVRRSLCKWDRIDALHGALLASASSALNESRCAVALLPFDAMLMDVSDAFRRRLAVAEAQRHEQTQTLDLVADRTDRSTPKATAVAAAAFRPTRAQQSPLRVGYLSFDFRDHAMGQLVLGFLESHDARVVETTCYSYGRDDGSEWRARAETSCNTFRDVAALSDLDAAQLVVHDRVDVLVDLMGHTTGARLGIVTLKPSPVIVNYLGYPGTSGSRAVDFVIVDHYVLPPEHASAAMTEQVVYLPTTYQSNRWETEPQACINSVDGSADAADDLAEPTCVLATRAQHELPDAAVVFANMNTLNKMEPTAFSVWMRILHQVPHSVLWLLAPGRFDDASSIEQTLQREAQAHGVPASRIVFAPWTDKRTHQARLTLVDIFLDTLTYTAHSTATDVLHAHVPVVTLWGDTFPSRVAASLVRTALSIDVSAHSVKEYEHLAVQLALDRVLRHRLRRELAAQTLVSPLFDSARTTKHLEAAYTIMHDVTHSVRRSASVSSRSACSRFHVLVHPEASTAATAALIANTEARKQQAVRLGLHYQQRGELATARYFYTRALQSAPVSVDALHLLATLDFAQGHARRARRVLHRVVALAPDVPLFRMNTALVHTSLDDPERAAEQLKHVLRLEPWNVAACMQLVDFAVRAKQYDAAVEVFRTYGSVILDAQVARHRNVTHQLPSDATVTAMSSRVSDDDRERAFLRFSYVLALAGRTPEAIDVLQTAVTKHQTYYRAGYNLVALYNDQKLYRTAESWLIKVVRAESYFHWESRGASVRKLARPTGRRVVAIYCYEYGQAWWAPWGPSSLGTGLGGSEQAVVFLAAELHALGYWVEVYGDPPTEDVTTLDTVPDSGSYDGVAWYPHAAYDPDDTGVDVFVAWRYYASLVVGQHARARLLWLHDVPPPEVSALELLKPTEVDGVGGVAAVVCVSAFHASLLPHRIRHDDGLAVVIPNALSAQHHFVDGANHATHFVYGSAPSRGLERVLQAWPRIRAVLPDATLAVYYGFTPAFDAWAGRAMPDYDNWKRGIVMQLQTLPGVQLVGAVGQAELTRAYAAAGFYLYPTTFSETSAVSLMQAMAAGAVPITSRFVHSALAETCGAFDLGPQPPVQSDTEAATPQWLDKWIASVVAAARDPHTHTLRGEMKAFARVEMTWTHVAQQWHHMLTAAVE